MTNKVLKSIFVPFLIALTLTSLNGSGIERFEETTTHSFLKISVQSNQSATDSPIESVDYKGKNLAVRSTAAVLNATTIGCAMVPVYLWHLADEGLELPNSALYPVSIYTGLSYGLETGLQRFFGVYDNNRKWWFSQVGGLGNGLLYAYYLYQVEAEHGLKGQYAVFFGCLAPFLMVNEALTLGTSFYNWTKPKNIRRLEKFIDTLHPEELEAVIAGETLEVPKKGTNKWVRVTQIAYPIILSPFSLVVFSEQIKSFSGLEEDYNLLASVPLTLGLCGCSYKIIGDIGKEELKSLGWLQSVVKAFLPATLAYEGLASYGVPFQATGTILFGIPFLLMEQKSIHRLVKEAKEWIQTRRFWRLRKWLKSK